ncbi:P-loop NTPase fold protein [Zoogloea sp.]|uniref:KAP family P-loop NTPase fold protein n=1 Tax=Zoogloea sp. TaxID=49181 RepID=UPI0025FB80C9|nr:P-loop NTPase fold protein [Zoogloea sp.]MCK6392067.1 KAP family NTPase [Zoogloea sp.]
MNFKPSPITITKEAPYAEDRLGRKACAEVLTNVLNSAPDGLVLCINGTWGSGKSTFIEMWRTQLEGDFTTMLFNAWESDFVDDAMVALLGDLQSQAEELAAKGCPDPAAEKIAVFKRLGSKLVRGALPFAIKAATAGMVDIDNDALKDLLVDEAGKLAEAQIEAYAEAKASIAGFKDALTELAEEIGVSGKPLVIFVDELDRCRPPFAVRVLEVIKHFFSVPGVVFVLALDREQLGHSIKSMYGADMDVGGYLRRFFDLEFNLPKGNGTTFVGELFRKFGLAEAIEAHSKQSGFTGPFSTQNLVSSLFDAFSCSPRDQEKCFTHYALTKIASPRARQWSFMNLFMAIVLRIKQPELYQGLLHGSKTIDDVLIDLSKSKRFLNYLETHGGTYFEWYLRALSYSGMSSAFLSELDGARQIGQGRVDRMDALNILRSGFDGNLQLPPIGGLRGIDTAINLVEHFSS